MADLADIQSGKEAREHFRFAPSYRHLNHGSFGTYPIAVSDAQRYYQQLSESRPDPYIIYQFPNILRRSRQALATYVDAPVETCVFVQNATTGINTVLRNLHFHQGDVVVCFTNIYGACKNTVTYLEETTPVKSYYIELSYPALDEDVCIALHNAINALRTEGRNPRVAIFDTISSMPGVRMPFERLTRICQQFSVLSLIDGAHGIGHIPLSLSHLDPDFFVSNCHKWLFTPRGCALLYVPVRNQHLIRSTLPTSHGFVARDSNESHDPWWDRDEDQPQKDSDFTNNFSFMGSADMSPYACVSEALRWRSRLVYNDSKGEDAVFKYFQDLARRAGEICCAALPGSSILENEDGTLGCCAFTVIRLPLDYAEIAKNDQSTAYRIWAWMKETCTRDYDTHFQFSFYKDAWWVRLSAQVYLDEHDFVWAGAILKQLCQRTAAGEWKAAKVKRIL